MGRSFYHYLMTYRDPELSDEKTEFARHAYRDHSFPKQSTNYHQLCDYLEFNVTYLPSMRIFDELWESYLLDEEKHK